MEVSAEAKRIMVVALGKLYSSRTQRGGLRLHRSLLLTMVMKSARDMYHAAQARAESVEGDWEQRQQQQQQQTTAGEVTVDCAGAQKELQVTGKPLPSPREEVTELRHDAENKENLCSTGPAQHSRKRRGKAALEPDFLPCKKAKLEQANCPQQLLVNVVLLDYMNCSSEVGAAPMPLHRAIAAC